MSLQRPSPFSALEIALAETAVCLVARHCRKEAAPDLPQPPARQDRRTRQIVPWSFDGKAQRGRRRLELAQLGKQTIIIHKVQARDSAPRSRQFLKRVEQAKIHTSGPP